MLLLQARIKILSLLTITMNDDKILEKNEALGIVLNKVEWVRIEVVNHKWDKDLDMGRDLILDVTFVTC